MPQWAALIAIADQGRSYAGLSTLTSGGSLTEAQGGTQASIYNLSAADFHDITSGSNGGYSAGAGYDGVTGLGSPLAGLVIEDLATGINGTGSPVSTSFGLTGGGSTRGGSGGCTRWRRRRTLWRPRQRAVRRRCRPRGRFQRLHDE